MILDSKLEFSDAQSVILGAAASVDSANVIDLGVDGKDAFGDAQGNAFRTINWYVNVLTAIVGDTVTVQLVCATEATLDTVRVLSTIELADAQAVGSKFSQVCQARDLDRYIGLIITAGATEVTAGDIDSGMILGYNDSELSDK